MVPEAAHNEGRKAGGKSIGQPRLPANDNGRALEEAPMSSSRLTGPLRAAHTDPQIARTQNRSASCARRPANNRLDTSGQAMNTVESALPMEQPWPT